MRLILLIFTLFASSLLFGQKKYSLTFSNTSYALFKKNITTQFSDSLQAKKYLIELQLSAIKKGYILASIDSLSFSSNELKTSFYLGPKFGNAKLQLDELDLRFFKKYMHVNENFFNGLAFTPHEISRTLRQMQNTLENNGYPFSKVYLDDIKIEGTNLTAHVTIEKNEIYNWNEIHIKGDSSISKVFLSNIIRIKPGDKYSQQELKEISKRLKQINFLKEIKNHEVLFTKSGAELFLYVKSNPISSVNGVIGLQPNSKTNKLDVTGEISLKLLNILKKGELLEFNWKSIQPQTQSLKGKINYPFILKSPFGVDGQFNLYKRDSTYLEIKSTLGVQYFLKGGNYLKAFYQNYSSSILSGGNNNPKFVNLGSVNSNNYGLAILRKQVDYVPNPSRGFILNSEIAIGSRKSRISDTSKIINSNTYKSELSLEFFIPLTNRHVIRIASQNEFYYAPKIFQNEVTRFGGLTSQRGFNEEELFSTTKSLMSIEYRFLVDQNSRAFLFYDQSWYENNAATYYKDHPFGFGAGFSFGTNIGIFSISYAQGKQFNNPILIKNGKVHFGYVAYF
jgi:outer membrane protein assembly factor BamA